MADCPRGFILSASNTMNKTKFDRRLDDAANLFFDHEQGNFGDDRLSFARAAALEPAAAATPGEKGDALVKGLKRVFIFFPGALYLFFGTVSVLTFDFLWNPFAVSTIFLIGALMTVFGLGSLKNPKHLAIPLAIVAVGGAAFAFFSAIGGLRYVFAYDVYFFPLALVAAFLVKSLGDEPEPAERRAAV